ncbi:MAG: ferric reductase-like transmembrane domain-containing protein [Alphaproteobacteria bacterium]
MALWTDRTGTFSPVKAAALALTLAPALWIAAQALLGWLGPRPYTAAIHQSGDWAVRVLLVSLAISPFRHIFRTTKLFPARRIIGVAGFAYVALHLVLYIGDQRFNLVKVATEIVLRFYLTIGFVALLALAALAITSTDNWIKRLGADRWQKLHQLVFPAVLLALIHDFIQARLDVTEPVLMSGLFLWLLGARVLVKRRIELGALALVGLAVVASALTAGTEIAWYSLVRGAPALAILENQFDFEFNIRPTWWVLAAGLAVAASRLVSARFAAEPAKPMRRTARA